MRSVTGACMVVAAALALGACGGSGTNQDAGSSSPSGSPTTTLAAAPRTVEEFFDDSFVHELHLRINPADWQKLKELFLENFYYSCDLIWSDKVVSNLGIRSRGTGSRSATKPGLRVDFDRYVANQEFVGLKSFVLDNNTQDPSNIRERLTMLLFGRLGLVHSREASTRFYVNDEYIGLYNIVESVDKSFLKRTFGENDGYLYKYDFAVTDPSYRFEYRGPDPSLYSPKPFKPETHELDPNPAPIVDMIRTMNQASDAQFQNDMAPFLDLSLFMRHVAAENFMAEWDGILGYAGLNNFYFYRFERRTLSQFIVWDKDNTFRQIDYPIFQGALDNVLMRRALGFPNLQSTYLNTLLQSADSAEEGRDTAAGKPGWLEQEIVREYTQIHDWARQDTKKPFSNDDFEKEIEYMKQFARDRGDFVRAQVALTTGPSALRTR